MHNPHIEHQIQKISTEGPTRQLEAEVAYRLEFGIEEHPYGNTVCYEQTPELLGFTLEYLTDDLTAEEKEILKTEAEKGPR